MDSRLIRRRGGLRRLAAYAAELGFARPMIVCGRRLLGALDVPGAVYWTDFSPNPAWEDCVSAHALFAREGCDGLIAVGGGSALDTAKGVKAIASAGSAEAALRSELTRPGPAMLAVPTTAGTGSETTSTAVVYVGLNKVSVAHPSLRPEAALLDAETLRSLPDLQKKACALDAFCQGVESFWARGAAAESRRHAEAAFLGVLRHIRPYLAGDGDAAEAMLTAAYESGLAIEYTRTTAAHAMSYRITKRLGCPHGHACALTLPALWRRLNADPDARDTAEALAGVLGLAPADAPRLAEGLLLALDLPTPWNPGEDMLRELAGSVNLQRLANHPQVLDADSLLEVYRESLTPPETEEAARCRAVWEAYHG